MALQPIASSYNQLNPSIDNFNFTGLTREEIIQELNSRILTSKYKNLTESSLAKLMMNAFASMVDINNFNIQRRAEEAFFDTASLKSSFIGNARNLGYDITRPVPASAIFSAVVKWTSPSNLDTTIVLSQHNPFSYNNISFINIDDLQFKINYSALSTAEQEAKTYTVTPDDLYNYVTASAAGSTSACKVLFVGAENDLDYSRFTLLQGEFKYVQIYGNNNNQTGQKFQSFKINDMSFSDYYGANDLRYSENTKGLLTKVAITSSAVGIPANAFDDANCFIIDRRSLLKPELVNNYNFITGDASTQLKLCLIRTAKDQTVELKFGDGTYTSLGLNIEAESIYVKYFSTIGAGANNSYVKDDSIAIGFTPTAHAGVTITAVWYSNAITNGLNLESNESIEVNAPAIYASLDKLITRMDYKTYLKKRNYTNAIVWGESEERKFFKTVLPTSTLLGDVSRRLFNIVMFSCTHPLYSSINNNWEQTELSVVNDLDQTYDSTQPFAKSSRNIYNIMVNQDYISNDLEILPGNSNLRTLLDDIESKSSFSIKPVYVSPFIHNFDIVGNIKIESFVNVATIRRDIQNKLYAYLNDINDFNSEVKISNITEIINSFTGVKYSDIKFVPSGVRNTSITLNGYKFASAGYMKPGFVTGTLVPTINSYFSKHVVEPEIYSTNDNSTVTINSNISLSTVVDGVIEVLNLANETINLGKFTMRNFIFELVPLLLTILQPFVEKWDIINDLYNAFSYTIRMNMLDSNGNISPEYNDMGKWLRGGYSLGNELISFNMNNTQIKY